MPNNLLAVARSLYELQREMDENPLSTTVRCKAISACYYAVFRATSSLIANQFSPPTGNILTHMHWHQVFRSLDHRQVVKAARQILNAKKGLSLGANKTRDLRQQPLKTWAKNVIDLQQRRHEADYDPQYYPSSAETEFFLRLAEDTCSLLHDLSPEEQSKLVVDLAFPPRANT